MINQYVDKALLKLKEELPGIKGKKENIMKTAGAEALESFCRQDGEFAQAVVQGGAFADCMKAVANDCGNAISDLEAFRRAVRFYFPGADVKFHMTVNLCAGVEDEDEDAEPEAGTGYKILNLEDFL